MLSNSDSKFKEFLSGFLSPVRVLGLLLEHPHLMILFILPMVLTITVASGVIFALIAGAWSLSQSVFQATLHSHFHFLSGITASLIGLLLIYGTFLILNILIQFFASPFNDLLAKKTELALGFQSETTKFYDVISIWILDFRKTLILLIFTGILTFIAFIPPIGLLSLPGFALLQAFAFFSYPQNRRKSGIRASWAWMMNYPFRSLGFGLASLCLFSVPVINLFALPLAVMAGTLTYLKK